MALGPPAAVVQLARELLYRACELSLNLDADAATTREIYERFLSVLENVGPFLGSDAGEEQSDDGDDDDGQERVGRLAQRDDTSCEVARWWLARRL